MAIGRMSFLRNFLNLILLKYFKVSLQKLILMKIKKMTGKIFSQKLVLANINSLMVVYFGIYYRFFYVFSMVFLCLFPIK